LGWEVIAFTATVDDMPVVYMEMSKDLYDKVKELKCI